MHHKWMYGDCGKTFSDGTTLRQAAHQAHVSLQTALLWKRKMQRMPKNASDKVLSGDVWVDHAYINAPMSRRKGKKKRGLSRQLMQVAVGIDSQGGVLLRLGSRGLAGTGDSMDAFLGHIAPGSTVYHDMGHFAGCFPGCTEEAGNSKDGEAYKLLNPVNRLCAQVKRLFAVCLRIHRKNVPLWLSEKALKMEQGKSLSFGTYRALFYRETFLSGKTLRRRDVYQH